MVVVQDVGVEEISQKEKQKKWKKKPDMHQPLRGKEEGTSPWKTDNRMAKPNSRTGRDSRRGKNLEGAGIEYCRRQSKRSTGKRLARCSIENTSIFLILL